MAHLQLCHYPGCKARLRVKILPFLLPLAEGVDEFVDVFAGAGGIALEMMYQRPEIAHVINDADPTMIALWLAVRDYQDALSERIERFIPTLAEFHRGLPLWRRITALPESPGEIIELAVLRLVHQSLSQSGMVDGGPRGGKYQSKYPIALTSGNQYG
jgi:D12 class N6 adenine-specific DNA methyltransferase